MFLFLLSLVALAKITHQTQAQSPSPSPSPSPTPSPSPSTSMPSLNNKDIIPEINKLRKAIATGQDAKGVATGVPQTDQMFKLREDSELGNRALLLTMMCDNVRPPPAPFSYVYQRSRNVVTKKAVQNVLRAWFTAASGMDNNATYTADMNNIGPVIYYKSTAAGCAVAQFNCSSQPTYGFACVFNNRPEIGKPLYPVTAKPKKGTGCTPNPLTCPEVDRKASTCKANLCVAAADATFPPNVAPTTAPTTVSITASNTASTAAVTSATSSSTPTTPTTTTTTTTTKTPTTTTAAAGVITKEMQDTIVLMHNHRRMMAARGTVQNGKSGTNLPEGANLNELRYDPLLGDEAQKFAQSCPTNSAATVNNYEYGQNVLIAPTVSIPYGELIESAIRNWFDEIYVNGMNRKMNFTDFLATKPNPPTHFTQMVWANHMTVGCGMNQCGSNTVVVCRYKPAGNIIGQFVYKVGPPCSACQFGCNTQFSLCIVPKRN